MLISRLERLLGLSMQMSKGLSGACNDLISLSQNQPVMSPRV